MKLLINEVLSFSTTVSPGTTDDELDDFYEIYDEFKQILDANSVYSSVITSNGSVYVTIEAQKIVLEEEYMAELIHGVLREFWNFDLRFTPLGGHDLTFTIENAIQHYHLD